MTEAAGLCRLIVERLRHLGEGGPVVIENLPIHETSKGAAENIENFRGRSDRFGQFGDVPHARLERLPTLVLWIALAHRLSPKRHASKNENDRWRFIGDAMAVVAFAGAICTGPTPCASASARLA